MTYPQTVANPFGKILLITGNSEFLSDRAKRRAIAAVREASAGVEVAESSASSLGAGEFTALTSASLSREATAVVLTESAQSADAAATELLDYAANTSADTAVILVHSGGVKGKGLLDKLRKCASVDEIAQKAPKYERDLIGWVRTEVRDQGRTMDDQAATMLVSAVGSDLRSLAAAVDQLVSVIESTDRLDVAAVSKYFGGRAEVRGYEIADAALDGRLGLALERVRWSEAAKVPPILVTAAMSSGLRQVAQVATAAPALSDGDLAKAIGAPPFKVRTLRQVARGWDEASLQVALAAVAHADRQVKGGGADPNYAVEKMIIDVAVARSKSRA